MTRARACFQSGLTLYERGDYDGAGDRFEEGYRIQPLPVFLYNIAQAARKAGRLERANEYYARYLAVEPHSPKRLEVEQHLAAIEQALAASHREAVPETPVEPPRPAPPVIVVAPPPPVPRPIWRRGWFWGAIAGAAVAATAVGLGVGLGYHPAPSTTLPRVTF